MNDTTIVIVYVEAKELPEILGICEQIGGTPSDYFLGLHRTHKDSFLKTEKEKQESEQKKRFKCKKDLN